MEQQEIKDIVAKLLKAGESLSKIQELLKTEHQQNMTFLDLRLLASELEGIDWTKGDKVEEKKKSEKKKKTAEAEVTDEDEDEDEDALDLAGKKSGGRTVVELNKIARPGAMVSGKVKFASGVKADWVLDQLGRLGLEKASGQPTPEDVKEFQLELQKVISRGGY